MTSGSLLALRNLRKAAIAGAILASVVSGSVAVGKTPGQKKTPKTPAAQPRLDEAYSAKIKEYTTEPFFLTELVDHLPA
ncbi:MAG TPA: hypothetical protein VN345_05690, partial [Blastocatellia bacterium]|nr:hypothetical protein [Blastocatellia bacterium]